MVAGSGITLFVIQSFNPLNTTLTLDGNTATTASLANLANPSSLAYNVTLYSVQSLTAASHMLDVRLVDYIFSNGSTMGSMIRFDSAAVNETSPFVVSPTSSGAGSSGAGTTGGAGASAIAPTSSSAAGSPSTSNTS